MVGEHHGEIGFRCRNLGQARERGFVRFVGRHQVRAGNVRAERFGQLGHARGVHIRQAYRRNRDDGGDLPRQRQDRGVEIEAPVFVGIPGFPGNGDQQVRLRRQRRLDLEWLVHRANDLDGGGIDVPAGRAEVSILGGVPAEDGDGPDPEVPQRGGRVEVGHDPLRHRNRRHGHALVIGEGPLATGGRGLLGGGGQGNRECGQSGGASGKLAAGHGACDHEAVSRTRIIRPNQSALSTFGVAGATSRR
jgi:hypothetical protein